MAANSGRNMLPLQSLLNPASSGPSIPKPQQYNPFLVASPADSARTVASSASTGTAITGPKSCKVAGESQIQAKSKPRGPVLFPPFEDIGQDAVREVLKFQVTPFGRIHQEYHHIPYSSSKKDLFDKTGRESIEAFKYEFRVPGRETAYVVMWDYNIGIVRMNPFIKWGRFPKTKSSQLLDKNPGLRDISPGITGGAVLAQGYWVPYRCAKALFATFCFPIAGAMIPLFGPSFPSECIPPEAPNYGTVTISRSLIAEVTLEAERYRRYYLDTVRSARSNIHDQHHHHELNPNHDYYAINQEAHSRHPVDSYYSVARPEHFASRFMPRPVQPGQHQATAQPTHAHYTAMNPPHSMVHHHARSEPYRTAAILRNQQATARNSELSLANSQWPVRPRQSLEHLCHPDHANRDSMNLESDHGDEQNTRPFEEKHPGEGELTISSPANQSRNSSQFTAAMALVMLSEDQREEDRGVIIG